ncbi:MAG: AraC family transcriptional regulator [Bacteroidetes bacterium]|nr:AraC family transcriptional regulator [Bacteroidota bacterium]
MSKKIQIIDESAYVRQFTKGSGTSNSVANNPIRVYRMEDSAGNIKTPTPLFRASFNCISLVTQGYMKILLDNEIKHVTKNSLLISRSGHISATLDFSEDVSGYFLAYEDEMLNNIFSKHEFAQLFSADPFVDLSDTDGIWLGKLMELLEMELKKETYSLDIVLPIFQAAFRKIFTLNKKSVKIKDRSTEITFAFKELVFKHHIQQKEIDFYSKQLSVSNNYLARCVKTSTGQTPKNLLNERDIEHSKMLIQDPGKSLSNVAMELNYHDPSYFSRLFKKITGITPSEYRASTMHNLYS